MSPATVLMLVTAILETILAIPFVGGAIVIAMWYAPLAVMFILHIISLVFVAQEGKAKAGNVLGIVTSLLAWIPFVGWALHLTTAIVLYATFLRKPANTFSA